MEPYEYEILTRSIAMLSPRQMALNREEVLRILDDLASIRVELKRLKQGLRELLAEADTVEELRRHGGG